MTAESGGDEKIRLGIFYHFPLTIYGYSDTIAINKVEAHFVKSTRCGSAAQRVAAGKGAGAERDRSVRSPRSGGIRSVRLSLFAESYQNLWRAVRARVDGRSADRSFFDAKRALPQRKRGQKYEKNSVYRSRNRTHYTV